MAAKGGAVKHTGVWPIVMRKAETFGNTAEVPQEYPGNTPEKKQTNCPQNPINFLVCFL